MSKSFKNKTKFLGKILYSDYIFLQDLGQPICWYIHTFALSKDLSPTYRQWLKSSSTAPSLSQRTILQMRAGSLGLVVMARDSCPKDSEFESQRRILEGFFPQIYLLQNVLMLEKTEKRPGNDHSYNITKNIF